jgi:hypothetical protein
MVRVKKSLYWHRVAEHLLGCGLTPTEAGKVVKQAFPHTTVNGRHIGAYKRRLIDEGKLDKDTEKTLSVNEAHTDIKALITDEDKFIYRCSIGAQKRTLKCFEYKMTMEAKDDEGDIDRWIKDMAI